MNEPEESKHTPGPWKVLAPPPEKDAAGTTWYSGIRIEPTGFNICRAGGETQTDMANARLIASAPRMLALAERGVEIIEAFYGRDVLACEDASDEEKAFIRDARALIAEVENGR